MNTQPNPAAIFLPLGPTPRQFLTLPTPIRTAPRRAWARLSRLVCLFVMLLCGAAWANLPPSVAITAPASGGNYGMPVTIVLTVNAADSDGTVTHVRFYYGGNALIGEASLISGSAASGTYSYTWTSPYSGLFSVTAVATDNSGTRTTSAPITVNLESGVSAAIMSPATNSTFNAPANIPLTIAGNASQGSIAHVQVYNDGNLLGTAALTSGTSTSGSYVYNWNGVAAGSYSLTLLTTAADGAMTLSGPFVVNVQGPVTGMFFVQLDNLNTPRLVEDQNQQPVWRWDQAEPFGDSVPNQQPGSAGAFMFNMRYPGQYFDQETNLSYNYFRDYDPNIGGYKQSDPIGLRGGMSTYSYVKDRPIQVTDPRGLEENLPNANCVGYALGENEWLPSYTWNKSNPNWPIQFMSQPALGCTQINCNAKVGCDRRKVIIFVDEGNYQNFHAMFQQCNGLWASKNGDDPPVSDIPGPPIAYYRKIIPPEGKVRTTCWNCPKP